MYKQLLDQIDDLRRQVEELARREVASTTTYTDELIQDLVAAMMIAGPNVDIAYDDGTGLISIGAPNEGIEDMIGDALTGGAQLGIDVTYDDTNGTIDFDAQTAGDARYLLSTIISSSTWTPALTGSTTNPTVSYTTQAGRYTIIAGICFYNFNITIDTYSGGSGNIRISMPVASAATYVTAAIPELSGVDLNGVSAGVYIRLGAGSSSARLAITVDNAGAAETPVGNFAAGDIINAFGAYFV